MRQTARDTLFHLALLAMFVLALVVGCTRQRTGGSSAAPPMLDAVDPSSQSITFWYPYTGTTQKGMQALIAQFNASNRWHITVKGEYAGHYDDIYDKMIPAIAGNATPNIVTAYQNQAATYEQAGVLVDLTPYVDSTKWGITKQLDDFFSAFLHQDVSAQFGGKRLGFPLNRSVEVVYYNKDWLTRLGFSGPPESWDDFARMCERATTIGMVGYDINTDASNMFAQVVSRGGRITGAGGTGYDLDSPQLRASMRFMQRLHEGGFAGLIAERYGDETDFANRKVLFTMGSSSGIPFYAQAIAGSGSPFHWDVAAIPHSTAKPTLNIYGASVSVTVSTPAAELASWLFIRWMAEPKQQAAWTRASNYFPVRISAADRLVDYFHRNPQLGEAFRLLKEADLATEPPFSGYDLVRDAMTAAYDSILDGAAVDQTLAALNEKANRLYRESASD